MPPQHWNPITLAHTAASFVFRVVACSSHDAAGSLPAAVPPLAAVFEHDAVARGDDRRVAPQSAREFPADGQLESVGGGPLAIELRHVLVEAGPPRSANQWDRVLRKDETAAVRVLAVTFHLVRKVIHVFVCLGTFSCPHALRI